MKRYARLFLLLVLLAAFLPVRAAAAQAPALVEEPTKCEDFGSLVPQILAIPGVSPLTGAETCITVPVGAQLKGLVIFAHGYVFAYPSVTPPDMPWDQLLLRDPTTGAVQDTLPRVLNSLGFVFATTSYSKNGLAVKEGVADVVELVGIVQNTLAGLGYVLPPGVPFPVFLVGASEGGEVTTLAVEQHPEIFTGGVAACGPVGDFRKQINYWGDFRVVFDYYFGGNMLGVDPMAVPPEVMADWASEPSLARETIKGLIIDDLTNNSGRKTYRLLSATGAVFVPGSPETILQTVLGILDYNVMATNEASIELGGKPFDNMRKFYVSFPYDPWLNIKVKRVAADKTALREIEKYYQTTGNPQRPLVLLHTIADPIVPFWHTTLYVNKVLANNALANLAVIPVLRYGHCAFTAQEAVFAFEVMILKAQMQALTAQEVQQALPDQEAQQDFFLYREKAQEKSAADPTIHLPAPANGRVPREWKNLNQAP